MRRRQRPPPRRLRLQTRSNRERIESWSFPQQACGNDRIPAVIPAQAGIQRRCFHGLSCNDRIIEHCRALPREETATTAATRIGCSAGRARGRLPESVVPKPLLHRSIRSIESGIPIAAARISSGDFFCRSVGSRDGDEAIG